ncbi:MAG: ACP phosphodiesterase [Bacteroidota bacterium]|nr:ACP phosphodiesterase [Bacteroidota bacterium]
MALFLQMNYLAHAFLSFNDPDILTGNMISDFVKGKRKTEYPFSIQKGIHLHRLIDQFTDTHEVTAKAKEFFRPQYRLYSGAFVDIVYDHFLALDNLQFVNYPGLKKFTEISYQQLSKNSAFFPLPFQKMFPYMKTQNWLYNYRLKEGISKSFEGLVYRAAYLYESVVAFQIFNEKYRELENCYLDFFPELKAYALKELSNLSSE